MRLVFFFFFVRELYSQRPLTRKTTSTFCMQVARP